MSDYARYKVLRFPISEEMRDRIDEMKAFMGYNRHRRCGYFETTGTDNGDFLDYVLYHSYGDEFGEFGKVRDLTPAEQYSFKHLFAQFFPDIDMSKVRYVDYCWYNCCETPCYYAKEDDPFYKELRNPTTTLTQLEETNLLRCDLCINEFDKPIFSGSNYYCPHCGALIDTGGLCFDDLYKS